MKKLIGKTVFCICEQIDTAVDTLGKLRIIREDTMWHIRFKLFSIQEDMMVFWIKQRAYRGMITN